MSLNVKLLRQAAEGTLDAIEMLSYTEGFEAAVSLLDECSNSQYNFGDKAAAEALRAAAKELRGQND